MSNDDLITLMLDVVDHTPGDRRAILKTLDAQALDNVALFLQSFTNQALYPSGRPL